MGHSLTPVSTVVSGYEKFLDDDTLYGRVLECSGEKHFFLESPTLANGHVSKAGVTVWEPAFKLWVHPGILYLANKEYRYHKENSGLSDAIP